MIILNTIAGVYLLLYVLYTYYILGYFPKSISITIEKFKEKGLSGWEYFILIGLSATTIVYNAYLNIDSGVPLLAIGGGLLFMVGVFAMVSSVKIPHYIAAIGGFGVTILALGLNAVIVALIASVAVYIITRSILFLEVALGFIILIFMSI
jgi:membrane glycosyltransferase